MGLTSSQFGELTQLMVVSASATVVAIINALKSRNWRSIVFGFLYESIAKSRTPGTVDSRYGVRRLLAWSLTTWDGVFGKLDTPVSPFEQSCDTGGDNESETQGVTWAFACRDSIANNASVITKRVT